jgi:hypothetical protein
MTIAFKISLHVSFEAFQVGAAAVGYAIGRARDFMLHRHPNAVHGHDPLGFD